MIKSTFFVAITTMLLPIATSHAQTMMQGSATSLDFVVNGTAQASATSAGNLIVRNDPTAANHVATKAYVDAATPAETDPQVGILTNGRWCTTNGSAVNCTSTAPVTSESDPQVNAVTNGQWCRGTGSQVTCDQSAPSSGIPSGAVMPFNLASCPSGWSAFASAQGRFVVGTGGGYALGNTGGAENVTLTVNEMPSHTHNTYSSDNAASPRTYPYAGQMGNYSVNSSGGPTQARGGDQPHENRPPYVALLYCQKD